MLFGFIMELNLKVCIVRCTVIRLIFVRALSDRAISMEEKTMACCVRGYHVYTLYSNGEYGHQIQLDVDPPD